MADIAMLMAEDYAKQTNVKNGCCSIEPCEERERGGGGMKFEFYDVGLGLNYVKGKIGEEKMKDVSKWHSELDAKFPIGIAACHGFFSA